ncbi:putative glutathione S-transferase [Stachybotrys elegans]|uniref:glutathione transferase n=1 Tax=Stachybotrys elegans TaxID=80388 RepID=A0A8K0SSA0_9HYPO|nr:putative glutathione S-transferase [Stachybotrys elegans]
MLVVHHLQRAQSERIVWLCEELGLEYELKTYQRDPVTKMSPPEYKALHPAGSAPIIQDGDVTLPESGAIVEYILNKYGQGKLSIPSTADNYADYLYYLHFCNGYFQPMLLQNLLIKRLEVPEDAFATRFARASFEKGFSILEERLSKHPWLAGEEFTAADIMIVFSLSTMRLFFPYSLEKYPAIAAFLKRVGERECYQRAMSKGDPGFEPILSVTAQ